MDKESIGKVIDSLVEEGLSLYKLHGTKPGVAKRIEKMNTAVKDAIDDIAEDADVLQDIHKKWNSVGNPINYDTAKIDEYLDKLEVAYTNIAKSVPALANTIKAYQAEVNKLEDMLEDNGDAE